MSESVILTDAEISALESSTSPAHSPQHFEETDTIVFNNCKTGLGIKIVGGNSEDVAENDFGIFVKRVIPGGLASESGRLHEGDQIKSVNNESLNMVSNERAVQLLRSASASNHVTLVISRGPQTLRRFKRLLENNQLARRLSGLGSGSATSYTSSRSHRIAYPGLSSQGSSPTSSVESFSSADQSDNDGRRRGVLHIIVSKVSGLGLHLYGGSDNQEGPGIFIDRVMEGGDCYRDGRVRVQDELVAINDQPLAGMTLKDAQAVVTRISMRSDLNSVSLSYIPSIRTPVNKDRDHTPSSHPSGISHSLSSPYQSPHPHSHHSSPQLDGMLHGDVIGQRTLPHLPSPSHHSPHSSNVPHPHVQGHTPVPQSNLPQQAVNTSHPLDSTITPRGGLTERRSPAVGQPAPSTLLEMNPRSQGNQGQMIPPSALPPHLQPGTYMEPKMTSTPEGVTTNGVSDRRSSVPLPPGGDPSPVLPLYNLSHYTNQPISFSASSSPAHSPVPRPGSRRLSIDPQVRLKIDKLQVALEYLGIHPSPSENQELMRRLSIDQSGMVPYGEFVAVAKQLFNMKLDDSNVGSGSMSHGGYDVTDFSAPPPFQHRKLPSPPPPAPPPPVVAPAPGYYAEMENLRKQRDDAIEEAEKLQLLVLEKERSFSAVEEELQRIRKHAQSAIHESKALKSRVHLAEVAQQEARNMELDYEEVVVMLEDELNKLRSKVKKMPRNTPPEPVPDGPSVRELQNRLAVLGCELRKVQASKRTYEVATEKLLQFAETVHEDLTESPNGTLSRYNKGENARRGTNGFRPPGYLARHKGPIDLASEAKETVKAVKALVESEPLPHGWEEAYTADGTKYFLNHVTQCTTWIHPLSGVNHLPSINERDSLPETRT
ncbi:syntaxin-binding protein 4-like [Lytechinus variegatus]|uniref:syntaxin-binding protein 4-like n=1 Tax=Lytechinus variegatus TaxID=7654 RepID=UPI001BB296E6|nr:syntaxin-binding protein 4-like [Lytechinus variegatus]XP_041463019.1 syntaxin-binding protein 4-like [Lytechinus variegatus]